MSRAVVLDFFGLEKANSSKPQFQKFLHRPKSFREFQGSISKIDPELLRTVIAYGSSNQNQNQSGSENQISSDSTKQSVSAPVSEISSDTAPMTIFYNGLVSVYDVPREKGECILKLAGEGSGGGAADPVAESPSADQKYLLEILDGGDLPIFRKKSLQRFIVKRKERLTWTSPYACPF